MNWIFLALLIPALYSFSNYIDKYLVTKYFVEGGERALTVISAAAFSIFLPILYAIDSRIFDVPFFDIVILMISGTFLVFFLVPYFIAMRENDASIVAPLFGFVPLVTLLFGYIFLGESISLQQFLAMLLVLFGSVIIATDITNSIFKVNNKLLLLMLLSSSLYAGSLIIFKHTSSEHRFTQHLFWQYVGGFLTVPCFLSYKPYRDEFMTSLQRSGYKLLSLNLLNETLTISGNFLYAYCILLAPVALVSTVASVQPFFLFAYGIILTLLFPHIFKEDLKLTALVRKFFGIICIFAGVVLIA